MDYPLFLVPYIGGGWLIGANAILHVVIAHCAIGGGLLIVVTEALALRRNDQLWLDFARRQSGVLVLLSSVLGALTGVGIWFTIGLVHSAATALLIHNFVWGWAIEWVFFAVEMSAALLYVATWDRLSRRTHLAVGWLYVVAAYLSLVVINGILSFMLTPGRWLETRGFWEGFFNPTYWPSLVLRTGIACMLAGVFGWLGASRLAADSERRRLVRYLSAWSVAGAVLFLAGTAMWLIALPGDVQDMIVGADGLLRNTAVAGLGAAALFGTLVVICGYLVPRAFGRVVAICILLLATTVLGSYERVREGARKPFVIHGYMYSNGVLVAEVERLNREGILSKARWAGAGLRSHPTAKGEQVFRAQCQSCHTLDGYLAIRRLVAGQDAEGMGAFLEALRGGRPGMPPIVGSPQEVQELAAYLAAVGSTIGGGR